MGSKLSLRSGMEEFAVHVDTAQTNITVGATKEELREFYDELDGFFGDVDE